MPKLSKEDKLKWYLSNPRWRMENLFMIEDKYGKLVQFKPNVAQKTFYRQMHTGGNIILKARQLGLSTGIIMWIFNNIILSKNKSAGIVDKTLPDAEEKLRKVKLAYDNLDNSALQFGGIGKLIKEAVKMEATSKRIEFSNGSSITAGRSLRGGTVQYLHISELGKIAIEEPKKAEEIMSGTLNTIAPGNFFFSESTHEGGRVGLHYKLLKTAMEQDPASLSPTDMKFFFFPWFLDPAYTIDPLLVQLRPEMVSYFKKLELEYNIKLTPGQKAWYDRKQLQQQEAMLKEFPSTPGEAFEASVRGAIYAKYISEARAEGRICDFKHEPGVPVFTFWDLGVSDYTSIWAVQFVGREILVLDWYEEAGKSPEHYAATMRDWDRKYGNIAMHYLPHDAGYRDKTGTTYIQYLQEFGIRNLAVVPRTPDIWIGINHTRDLLPRCRFHKTNCATPRRDDLGDEHPSGLDCLEAYRTGGVDTAGRLKEIPLHDSCSHSCFTFNELVLTSKGEKPIGSISAGDRVITPMGERVVSCAGVTGFRHVYEYRFSNGKTLTSTKDHPIFTDKGLVSIHDMDRLMAWTHATSLREFTSTECAMGFRALFENTTSMEVERWSIAPYIKQFTRMLMAESRKTTTSIMSTVTAWITELKILWQFQQKNIWPITRDSIGGMQCVSTAGRSLWQKTGLPDFVESSAKRGPTGDLLSHREISNAQSAEVSSLMNPRVLMSSTVQKDAATSPLLGRNGKVGLVARRHKGVEAVYNLTVEHDHCYYVNGFLVSNCDAFRVLGESYAKGMVGDGAATTQRYDRPQFRVITGGAPRHQKRRRALT